jgi:acetolactate decarboxylase
MFGLRECAMVRKYILLIFALICLGCAHSPKGYIFQNAVFGSFESGNFDGSMSISELKTHGDFGMGTLDGLDGEMVVIDGDFYQVKSDGKAYLIRQDAKSPFATVVFFEPDKVLFPGWNTDYPGLCDFIDKNIPSKDKFYALRIKGRFKSIKLRSVPKQTKPYPSLKEALVNQAVFDYNNIEGTLVGFRLPQYMEYLNVPGYHFHFISTDRSKGGHLLGCAVNEVSVEIDVLDKFSMELSQ